MSSIIDTKAVFDEVMLENHSVVSL